METTITSQDKWVTWLAQDRHISTEVAAEAGLVGTHTSLAIPVRNMHGEVIFYKYRRAPWLEDGPKYMYEKGSTASLYGIETLDHFNQDECVIITEGELDALALRTLGYKAVCGTGGAGTWRPEWSDLLAERGENVVIAYDADKAGVYGALKVASMTPRARIAWLPVQFGKDCTDIIHAGGEEALRGVLRAARHYGVPSEENPNRKELLYILQARLNAEKQEALQDRFNIKSPLHMDFGIEWVANELSKIKPVVRRARVERDSDEVTRAKEHPITDLIKVNREGKALCPFHDDRTPSMHVYKDNHAYCFVCEKRADSIDIYMTINHCDFKAAVAALQ